MEKAKALILFKMNVWANSGTANMTYKLRKWREHFSRKSMFLDFFPFRGASKRQDNIF